MGLLGHAQAKPSTLLFSMRLRAFRGSSRPPGLARDAPPRALWEDVSLSSRTLILPFVVVFQAKLLRPFRNYP